MLRVLSSSVLCFSFMAAHVTAETCEVLYERLRNEAPGDVAVCEPMVEVSAFSECTKPQEFSADRPPLNVVLVLDASGSMAGQIRGETKMDIAKTEISAFLTQLADDVPVGLIAFGHLGDNTEAGKTTSCNATDWIVGLGDSAREISDAVAQVSATGWTPLASVLDYARAELTALPVPDDAGDSVPYVYVLSDGKETCGGDPVQAARDLRESDVEAIVNVIGFDVDAETRAELEAISAAGGGRYLAAADNAALRETLLAEIRTTQSAAGYQNCLLGNVAKVNLGYHHSKVALAKCVRREVNTNGQTWIRNAARDALAGSDDACLFHIRSLAAADAAQSNRWFLDQTDQLEAGRRAAVEEVLQRQQANTD